MGSAVNFIRQNTNRTRQISACETQLHYKEILVLLHNKTSDYNLTMQSQRVQLQSLYCFPSLFKFYEKEYESLAGTIIN